MSAVTKEQVLGALSQVQDPDLHRDVVSLGFIKELTIEGGSVRFDLELTTPACPVKDQLKAQAEEVVAALAGVEQVEVNLSSTVRSSTGTLGQLDALAPGVKNIILVGSGKGGVGKSTVAVNLAAALKGTGASVGILDADVYGPSIPTMMGLAGDKPTSSDGKHMDPLEAHGIKTMSIGFLVEPDQALMWRGPMLSQAVVQFLRDVTWGELDYLVIDLPPGTGDVQLTIAQQVRSAGCVLVTTPQDVALIDVVRAKAMLDKVKVPVLGVVENMSFFVCPSCDCQTDIFDRGGGARAAEQLAIPFLGAVPLLPKVRQGGDAGTPIVAGAPESPEAAAFQAVAEQVAHQVSLRAMEGEVAEPTLRMAP